MNKYRVMFVEMDFACNAHELVSNQGERRWVYTIEANKIYDAYYKGIELVRKETKNLVRLNFCKLVEEN